MALHHRVFAPDFLEGRARHPTVAVTARIELCRVPVRDFDLVDLREKLLECVHLLERLLAASHLVYLHCTIGAARSPTVAIAYLHW